VNGLGEDHENQCREKKPCNKIAAETCNNEENDEYEIYTSMTTTVQISTYYCIFAEIMAIRN